MKMTDDMKDFATGLGIFALTIVIILVAFIIIHAWRYGF
jgi:hypothetical protein